MLVAKNSKGRLVKILDSIKEDIYTCPVCGEKLIRNFGIQKQYFSHPKDKDNTECEIKMKLILKDNPLEFDSNETDILHSEYYNKEFNDVKVELSDYMSEDGYYLTEEQKQIIFAKEDRVKISALAGSAKSSTLYYYSKERPSKKILYLVYNKAMKDEAEKSFGKLKNVEIKTTHGLAYKYVGMYYKHKLTFNYNAVNVIKDLNLDWYRDQEIAVKVYEMMKEYMLSNVETFEELKMYTDNENKKHRPQIIALCEKLWELKKDYNSKILVEHDFYLKLFQLSKHDLSRMYNIILLDEAQDSNMLILDILHNSNVRGIVIVGDPFQSLYGWRNALNILPLFKGKEYKLTTSFRVSQNIANLSNIIISDINKSEINMKGFNVKQKIVDKIDKSKPYACLCRTNSYIFAETIDAIENGKRALFYEGGYNSYNFNNILDSYYFSLGEDVKNPILNKFKDYRQMESYAEKNEDLELLALIRMINNYGSKIPNLINTIKNSITKDKIRADVIFSTIHRSKGMTYSIPVLISNDHFDIENTFKDMYINKKDDLDMKKIYEEMCIVYVAITRASNQIELSNILNKYLLFRYEYFSKQNDKKVI